MVLSNTPFSVVCVCWLHGWLVTCSINGGGIIGQYEFFPGHSPGTGGNAHGTEGFVTGNALVSGGFVCGSVSGMQFGSGGDGDM